MLRITLERAIDHSSICPNEIRYSKARLCPRLPTKTVLVRPKHGGMVLGPRLRPENFLTISILKIIIYQFDQIDRFRLPPPVSFSKWLHLSSKSYLLFRRVRTILFIDSDRHFAYNTVQLGDTNIPSV